jgi:acetoin utilization deacetylase AcuC-like enzyme
LRIYYSDHFVIPLPEGHRFPIRKYSLLRERLVMADLVDSRALVVPEPATDEQLELVHTHRYVRAVVEGTLDAAEVRRLGLPWSPALVERSRRSVGGTIGAARSALNDGYAANLAGGTHHAFADRGEGFCVFNDVAVATRVLQREEGVRRVVVIDTDVHQGNGTIDLCRRSDGFHVFRARRAEFSVS